MLIKKSLLYNKDTIQEIQTNEYCGRRGVIIDRNGKLLAVSVPTVSISLLTKDIIDKNEYCDKLCQLFPELNKEKLLYKMNTKKFVWIKRNATPKQQHDVIKMGFPGIEFVTKYTRVYPQKNLVCHTVGHTDIDGNGISGIEKYFDNQLKNNVDIVLSIDVNIQHIIRNELCRAMKKYNAVGAYGIVMNVENGEILAMVSLPDFDQNNLKNSNNTAMFNKCVNGVFEFGSIMKLLNAAIALETNTINTNTKIEITDSYTIGYRTIHDYKPNVGMFTIEEILCKSSNIGSAKIAAAFGPKVQKHYLSKVNFFDKIKIELAECQKPIFPKTWGNTTVATVAFGHGVAVTALHAISALSCLVNNGVFITPTIIKNKITNKTIVFTKEVCEKITKYLRTIVVFGGGKRANVDGYSIGGKSGTAEKVENGRYVKNKNICSFIGVLSTKNPKYVILVCLDEPKGINGLPRIAGFNAAPTAKKIIKRIIAIKSIKPDF